MSILSLLKNNRLLNVESAVKALGGSESLYEKVVQQVVSLIPSRIESLDGFLGAGGDLRDFGILAHGIKGTLMQIGCLELGDAAKSLEAAAKTGDRRYCEEHYSAFREELLRFYGETSAVFHSADSSAARPGSITDYYGDLLNARESALSYDSISAAETVSQLKRVRFGEETDALVSEASDALEAFQTEQALISINELIGICERRTAQNGGDSQWKQP